MQVVIKKVLFFGFILFSTLAYADGLSVQPYMFLSAYDKSFKDQDRGLGVYGSFKDDVSEWKFGVEYKSTTYTDNLSFLDTNNTSDTNDTTDTNTTDTNTTALYQAATDSNETYNDYDNYQGSLILGYSRKLTSHVLFDAAFHYIVSDLYQADQNTVFFAGLSYLNPYNYNVGLEAAYSMYNEMSLANDVVQFSPYFASWFGDPNSFFGRIYYKISYYYIIPFQSNVTLKDTYNHFELNFYQNTLHFINRVAVSFGEGINLVKDKGFTVYNSNMISDTGFLLSSTYKVDDTISVRGSYIYESFSEYNPILTSYTNSAKMSRFLISALFKF